MSKTMTRTGLIALLCALVLCAGALFGCAADKKAESSASSSASSEASSSSSAAAAADEVEMQYMTAADLMEKMDADDADLLIVDVRKTADYDEGHIKGAISADMDAAKDGDMEAGEATMKEALEKATGSDVAEGKTIVLVCYSGNAYAKAGTEVLDAIGADMKDVYTLEGGMKAWDADYPDSLVTE